MDRIVIDETLSSRLDQCTSRTELCAHDGRILGVYIPEAVRERRMYERAKAAMSPEFLEEIERRSQEPGVCYTTAEVMQKLRELEAKHST